MGGGDGEDEEDEEDAEKGGEARTRGNVGAGLMLLIDPGKRHPKGCSLAFFAVKG